MSRMGNGRNAFRFWVWKPKGKRPLGRRRRRRKDNAECFFKESKRDMDLLLTGRSGGIL